MPQKFNLNTQLKINKPVRLKLSNSERIKPKRISLEIPSKPKRLKLQVELTPEQILAMHVPIKIDSSTMSTDWLDKEIINVELKKDGGKNKLTIYFEDKTSLEIFYFNYSTDPVKYTDPVKANLKF